MGVKARSYTKQEFISMIEHNGYKEENKKRNAGNHRKWIRPDTKEEIIVVMNRAPNKMWCRRMIKEHGLVEV